MAKKELSLLDINRQIADLQKQADDLKTKEKSGVVGRIKEAIDAYGLTPADLFGSPTRQSAKVRPSVKKTKSDARVAYSDGAGKTWGGRGPRPAWLREALAAGKDLSDFAQTAAATATTSEAASVPSDSVGKARAARPKKSASKVAAKYKDEAGNTWSGRGMQPVWLKTALAQGKTLQDFAI